MSGSGGEARHRIGRGFHHPAQPPLAARHGAFGHGAYRSVRPPGAARGPFPVATRPLPHHSRLIIPSAPEASRVATDDPNPCTGISTRIPHNSPYPRIAYTTQPRCGKPRPSRSGGLRSATFERLCLKTSAAHSTISPAHTEASHSTSTAHSPAHTEASHSTSTAHSHDCLITTSPRPKITAGRPVVTATKSDTLQPNPGTPSRRSLQTAIQPGHPHPRSHSLEANRARRPEGRRKWTFSPDHPSPKPPARSEPGHTASKVAANGHSARTTHPRSHSLEANPGHAVPKVAANGHPARPPIS